MRSSLPAISLAFLSAFAVVLADTKEDDLAPKTHSLPSPEVTWTLNGGEPILGKITEIEATKNGDASITIAEVTGSGERPVSKKLSDLSDRDREFLDQYLTGVISGKVIGIKDGDTLDILTPAKRRLTFRLHGVDAPEGGQQFGANAKRGLSDLAFQKTVRIHIDSEDAYNRWVGTIFDESGLNLNLEMVKRGFAWHYTKYLPDNEIYAAAQKSAGLKRNGLWGMPNVISPWEYRALSPKERAVEKELAVKFATVQEKVLGGNVGGKKAALFWLNTSSDSRHNGTCRLFQKTKRGRMCTGNEGTPCGLCGG